MFCAHDWAIPSMTVEGVTPWLNRCWLVINEYHRYEVTSASDGSLWPGAITSGFAKPSYHDGPLELYGATVSSPRVTVFSVFAAPTQMAEGALHGEVTPA